MVIDLVYDAKGKIHHQHSVLTLVGGREPSEGEIEKDALFAATNRRKPPTGPLQVLHVPHDAMEPGKRYLVDVKKKALAVQG
jgi:hypothetical protein